MYNRFGALKEPFRSECDRIGKDAAQKLIAFCAEQNLSMEETTICFHHVQLAIMSKQSEHKLSTMIALKNKHKADIS